jgi:hypothetical protein
MSMDMAVREPEYILKSAKAFGPPIATEKSLNDLLDSQRVNMAMAETIWGNIAWNPMPFWKLIMKMVTPKEQSILQTVENVHISVVRSTLWIGFPEHARFQAYCANHHAVKGSIRNAILQLTCRDHFTIVVFHGDRELGEHERRVI